MLHPPGHAPHAFDLVATQGSPARFFAQGLATYLIGRLSARVLWLVQACAYAIRGEVTNVMDAYADRHSLCPGCDFPRSFLVQPIGFFP